MKPRGPSFDWARCSGGPIAMRKLGSISRQHSHRCTCARNTAATPCLADDDHSDDMPGRGIARSRGGHCVCATSVSSRGRGQRSDAGLGAIPRGDFSAARTSLESGIQRLCGGDAFDFLLLAMTCCNWGDSPAAKSWYDKAVAHFDRPFVQTTIQHCYANPASLCAWRRGRCSDGGQALTRRSKKTRSKGCRRLKVRTWVRALYYLCREGLQT